MGASDKEGTYGTVTADFQGRKRITFTTRDRAFTNVQMMTEDGSPPLRRGFVSNIH
jgi:hypothetical protein